MICTSEAGEAIQQIFARPDEFKGQFLQLASQRFTVEEYATILSKIIDTKKFVAGTVCILILTYLLTYKYLIDNWYFAGEFLFSRYTIADAEWMLTHGGTGKDEPSNL